MAVIEGAGTAEATRIPAVVDPIKPDDQRSIRSKTSDCDDPATVPARSLALIPERSSSHSSTPPEVSRSPHGDVMLL